MRACNSDRPVITDIRLEDGRLDLYFSEEYEILDAASEALLQAR